MDQFRVVLAAVVVMTNSYAVSHGNGARIDFIGEVDIK